MLTKTFNSLFKLNQFLLSEPTIIVVQTLERLNGSLLLKYKFPSLVKSPFCYGGIR